MSLSFFYRFFQKNIIIFLIIKKKVFIFIFKLELFHLEKRNKRRNEKKNKFLRFKKKPFYFQKKKKEKEMGEVGDGKKNHCRWKKYIATFRPSMKFFIRSNSNKNHLRHNSHGIHSIFEKFTFSVQLRIMFHGKI